jgi:probable HAF family extracellular repeat protein
MAFGINDWGRVVGYSHPHGIQTAFIWDQEHGMRA